MIQTVIEERRVFSTCVIHFWILCNKIVMYVTFPFYLYDLKDTICEKGIVQLKDG